MSAGFPVSGKDHSQPLDMCRGWNPHLQVAAFKICLQIPFRESGRWAFLPAPSAPIPEGIAILCAHVLVCYILEGLMGTTLFSFQNMVLRGAISHMRLKRVGRCGVQTLCSSGESC